MTILRITLCIFSAALFVGLMYAEHFAAQASLFFLSFTIFFMVLSSLVKNTFLRYAFIIIFSLSLPLTILETYFFIALAKFDTQMSHTSNHDQSPPKHIMADLDPADKYWVAHQVRRMPGSDVVLYDAKYSINSKGRRVTPYAPHARTAVVFLGCSFTFGDGLKDDATFPYILGKSLGKDYQVLNYGIPGAGAHRLMLALEKGIPNLEKYSQVIFYYVVMEDHVRGSVGAASWDVTGPLYAVREGKAVRIGTFEDALPFYRSKKAQQWLNKSFLYKKIKPSLDSSFAVYSKPTEQLALQGALMASMQDFIKNKYPKSSFRVLLWPPNTFTQLESQLKGIPHIDLEAWLPNFSEDIRPYVLAYPHEVHPSALTNEIIANKLKEVILTDAVSLQ